LGYRRAPDFEFHPPGELTPAQQIVAVLLAPGSRLRLACEREGIDVDEVVARVLHPLEEPNSEPRMVEQEMIGQDWGCSMENIPGGAMPEGVVPSTSGTQEPNQQRVDVSGMNTGGEGSDSDAESDLNGRKEQVRRGEQPREQGKLKPDKSTLSEHVDRSCNVMNPRGAKL
jgi:coenzyme A diphosphatase NUDT7